MMKSYVIDTHYNSGSYSSKTRHAVDITAAIENLLKEDCHTHKAKFITLTWKNVGGSQEQDCGKVRRL